MSQTDEIYNQINKISSLVDIQKVIKCCQEKQNSLQQENVELNAKRYLKEKYKHCLDLVKFTNVMKLKSYHRKRNGIITKYGFEIEVCFNDYKTNEQKKLDISFHNARKNR
jgi:hypothetical protein